MEWLYFSARPIVIPGPLFLAVSTVIVRLRCHLLWCSTSVKAFVFDSRFVFKWWLKQTVHIMAVALLFCAITLPIQCTTYWSPFQGCVQCTWHSVILHLFYFWPILHCILRLTLNYLSFFFILYPFCHCTLALRWLLFMQVLLSTAILFRSSDKNAWRLKKKLPSLL